MQYFTITLTAFLGIILLTPFTTHASITGQAYTFGDSQALFLIEFSFATQQNDYYIPIRASHHPEALPESATYDIIDSMTEESSATTASLVLSDLDVEDGHYHIPAGETGEFTLLIFADITEPNPLSEYHAQVNALPHLIGTEKTVANVSDRAIEFLATPSVQFPLVLNANQ